jgi:hypothetical protein
MKFGRSFQSKRGLVLLNSWQATAPGESSPSASRADSACPSVLHQPQHSSPLPLEQMGHSYYNILTTAFAAFTAIPAQAGSSPPNHPVYLALDGPTAEFEVIGSSLVSAQQVHQFPPIMSLIAF